jgi:hypothetical protein
VTAHRAQGITTDTSHVLVDPSTTRENLYVAMTRGRHANLVYVATDRPDDNHTTPHPADDPDATARSVLYGVLQHVGAELSAHETITAEQEAWGSVAQLAAEYETIAQAAQHDRFATLIRQSGLTRTKQKTRSTPTRSGHSPPNSAVRRRTTTTSTPSCRAWSRPAGSATPTTSPPSSTTASPEPPPPGRFRPHPQGAPPDRRPHPRSHRPISTEMRKALTERRELIEQRAEAVLDQAVTERQEWALALGDAPAEREPRQRGGGKRRP